MTGKLVPESLIPVIDVVGFMHRVLLLLSIILGHEYLMNLTLKSNSLGKHTEMTSIYQSQFVTHFVQGSCQGQHRQRSQPPSS